MKATLLTLRDNEGRTFDLLVRYYLATKDGINIKKMDNSHMFISDNEYTVWGVKEITLNPLDF